MAFIAQPRCKECGGRVWHAAKSHKHYTHLFPTDCKLTKIDGSQIVNVRIELGGGQAKDS